MTVSEFRLLNPANGQLWTGRLEGRSVTITAGSAAKPKTSTKAFGDASKADLFLRREALGKLRKGFRSRQPLETDCWHWHVGSTYSGFLPIIGYEGQVLCNLSTVGDDALIRLENGAESARVELPAGTFGKRFALHANGVAIEADDSLLFWSESRGITSLAAEASGSVAGSLLEGRGAIVWYDGGALIRIDPKGRKGVPIAERAASVHQGHTPLFAGCLFDGGKSMAVCTKPNEIELLSVKTGKASGLLKGDFRFLEQLVFFERTRTLVGVAHYGPWGLVFFDVAKEVQVESPFGELETSDGRTVVRTNEDGTALLVASGDQLTVLSTKAKRWSRGSRIDFVAKRFDACFLDNDTVAVRTDLGIVGAYRIAALG